MKKDDLQQEIIEIVAWVAEVDPAAIGLEDSLSQKHALHSLMRLELLAELEQRYKLELSEARLQGVDTLRQLIDIVFEEIDGR